MSKLRALRHSILEIFSDERLIGHRRYDDASIPLKRYMKTVGESLPNFSTVFVLDVSIKERRMVNEDTIRERSALELGVICLRERTPCEWV